MNLCDFSGYAGKRICVAVSGGADSVALLYDLFSQAEQFQIAVSAVTCEHGIRGKESLRDLAFVQSFCEALGVPLRTFRADVPALARENKRGLEEAGRRFRYACFDRILKDGEADFVATAHHRDDLAETVLFRLARGTSLSGLNAIRERDGLIRPLLNVSRAEIEAYVRAHRLTYRKDRTNRDQTYMRNKIRRTVMPALERVANGAGAHLAQFARKAEEDDSYLRSLAAEQVTVGTDGVRFPLSLPAPLFARACAIAFRALGVESYTEKNIAEIFALKELQSGRKASLPNGTEGVREGDFAVIYRVCEQSAQEVPFVVGEIAFGAFTVAVSETCVKNALVFDMEMIPPTAVLRTRREGDTFTPFGGNRKKLKKYLTDKKISARAGRELPLIADGDEVLAVCGVEISDKIKVTEATSRKAYLTLGRK